MTFETPLKRLPWFSGVLVDHLVPFEKALLVTDVILGEPRELIRLRRAAGEERSVGEAPGHAFESQEADLREAVEAALAGWIDFVVLFHPTRHALMADHDEWTTFFSQSPGKLAEVRRALRDGGAQEVRVARPAP